MECLWIFVLRMVRKGEFPQTLGRLTALCESRSTLSAWINYCPGIIEARLVTSMLAEAV